jgi:hypothetical protein
VMAIADQLLNPVKSAAVAMKTVGGSTVTGEAWEHASKKTARCPPYGPSLARHLSVTREV